MAVYGPKNNEELYHYGVKRKSGRYPWGSGKEPYQSNPAMAKKAAAENASKVPAKSAAKVVSASKNFSKKPETFWEKRRKAQAAKQREKDKATKAKAEEEARAKEAKANASKPAPQRAKEMSDEDLVRAINRLRLEQTYLSMVSPPPQQKQAVSSGKKFIDKLKSSTKDAADLAMNIDNITKGAAGIYANIRTIEKMMNGGEVKLPDLDKDKKKKG